MVEFIKTNGIGTEREAWLLRHGKAPHNKPDKVATFAGKRVDSGLSDEGKYETAGLAEEINEHGGVNAIVCSTMKRSRQTAEIIANKTKELSGKEIPVIEITGLEEVDVGDFTGLTEKEAKELSIDSAEAFYQGRLTDLNFPNGEDYLALKERVSGVLDQLRSLSDTHGRIAVVGHGMFNRILLHELHQDRKELWQPRGYPHNRIVILDIK
ncbi:MAG TPA: histidine phosphatase family protein [bacterium]|nr:histidine phosphatase family protein [bacterium]